jgi:hypothetical protein
LFCTLPSFAQDHLVAAPVSKESPREYNERWVEIGSKCISNLLVRAKLKRNQIWSKRFPDLKTLCIEYERYWYLTNLYADALGLPRQKQDAGWVKNALDAGNTRGQCPELEMDLNVIQKFRKDIDGFSGSGSTFLVDSAIPRFNHGEIYVLEGDKAKTVVSEDKLPKEFLPDHFIGDFWPYRKRFWGDPGLPGSRE